MYDVDIIRYRWTSGLEGISPLVFPDNNPTEYFISCILWGNYYYLLTYPLHTYILARKNRPIRKDVFDGPLCRFARCLLYEEKTTVTEEYASLFNFIVVSRDEYHNIPHNNKIIGIFEKPKHTRSYLQLPDGIKLPNLNIVQIDALLNFISYKKD